MKAEEATYDLPPIILHDIQNPDQAPQLVRPNSPWATIFLLGVQRAGYDDWLAWHFASILGQRYP